MLTPLDDKSGYHPDVIVLDKGELSQETRWQKKSIITLGSSVRLLVKVVTNNWRNDYLKTAGDNEAIGRSESWIVDYLGWGGRRFMGHPKSPMLSVYQVVKGEYEVRKFPGMNEWSLSFFLN